MSVVLDTHVWLWWVMGLRELPLKQCRALDALAESGAPPHLPALCMWEAQMLHAKGRIALNQPFDRWLREATNPKTVSIAPLTVDVILEVTSLPASFHGDPADRVITATARSMNLPLATHDRNIRRSRVVTLWHPPRAQLSS